MTQQKIYPFFFVFLASYARISGQSGTGGELDLKYTPPEGIFWQKGSRGKAQLSNHDISAAVKYFPFDLLRGNVVVEADFNPPNSMYNITVGAGINCFPNYLEKTTPIRFLHFMIIPAFHNYR